MQTCIRRGKLHKFTVFSSPTAFSTYFFIHSYYSIVNAYNKFIYSLIRNRHGCMQNSHLNYVRYTAGHSINNIWRWIERNKQQTKQSITTVAIFENDGLVTVLEAEPELLLFRTEPVLIRSATDFSSSIILTITNCFGWCANGVLLSIQKIIPRQY